jgi:hypothetical protein
LNGTELVSQGLLRDVGTSHVNLDGLGRYSEALRYQARADNVRPDIQSDYNVILDLVQV